MACASASVAPDALLSVSVTVSPPSSTASSVIGTAIVFAVSPGSTSACRSCPCSRAPLSPCRPTWRSPPSPPRPPPVGKTALLARCCRDVRDRGFAVVWLSLEEDGPGSVATHLALAFERAGLETFDPAGERGRGAPERRHRAGRRTLRPSTGSTH